MTLLVCSVGIALSPCRVSAQDTSRTQSSYRFGILVLGGKQNVELSCKKGCAWKTLSFTPVSKQGSPTIVGPYGTSRRTPPDNSELVHFTLSFERVGTDSLNVRGVNGTSWKELTIALPHASDRNTIPLIKNNEVVEYDGESP